MVHTESSEMYLETILILKKRNGIVRSVDIAREMDFSKPSVSRAMDKLKEADCIYMDENNLVHLTEKGSAIAEKIYERHMVVLEYLESIGVSPEVAEEDACAIEHVISDETFEALKKHYRKSHGVEI